MNSDKGITELLEAALDGKKNAENELFSKLHERFFNLVRYNIWRPMRIFILACVIY